MSRSFFDVCCPSTLSYIFFEATWPIEAIFHLEHPRIRGKKTCPGDLGQMAFKNILKNQKAHGPETLYRGLSIGDSAATKLIYMKNQRLP